MTMIGDNGEGMVGLGIEGVKKEVLRILEDKDLSLGEKGEIGHVITRDTWSKKGKENNKEKSK